MNRNSAAMQRMSRKAVVVRLAHFACEPLVSFFVVDEFFVFWVPFQFSSQTHREHAEVTDGDGPVADFRFAHWLFARADAVEEILHVIFAVIKPRRAFWQRLTQKIRVACFD